MNIEEWPEGASHKIEGIYTKWIGEDEYSWMNKGWEKQFSGFRLSYYVGCNSFEIIERPVDTPYMPKVGEWCYISGEKVLYLGVGVGDMKYIFQGRDERFIKFDCLDFAEPANIEREEFIEKCFKDVQIHNCVTSSEIAGRLYDSGARFTNKP
tara:strand:+ start:28744 stop:29202 length:459 start_codon:yes stop_codon:yes gene_type:complete